MITPISAPSSAISPINNLFSFDDNHNRQNNPFITYLTSKKEKKLLEEKNKISFLGEDSLNYKSLNFFA